MQITMQNIRSDLCGKRHIFQSAAGDALTHIRKEW